MENTIVAIATAHGIGGISIVRVSGDKALFIAKTLTKKNDFKPRYASLLSVTNDKNELIDEAIVIYFKAPYSFTGEDVVEFQCHGGLIVSSMIVDEVIKLGASIAKPGEFSKRAVLNDRIDLSQAEAISKLIVAKSQDAVKIVAKQLKGSLSIYVDEIRDELIEILAFIEVNIDYAEEDLPEDLSNQIIFKLENIKNLLYKSLEASRSREGLMDGFKVSIIGKPNVGKSTLLNSLLEYDRAIISDIAGTTRDTIEESLRVGTHLVKIVDTAGIRESDERIEQIGIKRTLLSADESEIIIAVFDASCELDDNDDEIVTILNKFSESKSIIVVINKCDSKNINFNKKRLESLNPIEVSFKNSTNEIIDALKVILDNQDFDNDLILISKRQVDAVSAAYDYIVDSLDNLSQDELELFAYNINDAINSISLITKSFQRDEILDKMFSSFCLGK
ncbi:MAG TPA: tRNA uridine-5-carboxymethylaminomethyl(34) synthesis GTPase MnmE [Campylobacterales bacterium]|nr:tRNA uridine-5-carboxymethylaminomethyl(34) synthesis GTPase MnmE [Campylobacterales bacterium]